MTRASSSLSILFALGLAGCTAPGLEGFTSYDEPPGPSPATGSTGATSSAPNPTTTGAEAPTTSTGEVGSTSSGEGSSGAPAPIPPPMIFEEQVGPSPLELPGAISAMLVTAHADGVRMQVDDAAPVELTPAEPDIFMGEIAPFRALDNGEHQATFVAWREELESAPLVRPFTIALPASGSELYWEADSALGQGTVVALAVTPNQELLELGTHQPMGQPRCYLRRRDLGGAWAPVDVIDLMPDTPCSATDLAIDASGGIHILAEKIEQDELRWWLGKLDSWGAPVLNVGSGVPGETASALATSPDRVAVCGSKPSEGALDAAVWIYSQNTPGKVLSFDYWPEGKDKGSFHDAPGDCVFTPTRLALVGTSRGPHDPDQIFRDRHFVLEVDVAAGEGKWTVAGPGQGTTTQSRGNAIAVDPQGRYFTGGLSCDENCSDPRGEIRMFSQAGVQAWHRPFEPGVAAPQRIAWSPFNYLVIVSSQDLGPNDTAFLAQAWIPVHAVPLWSYDHHDAPDLQSAAALAIGPHGQIYAGGAGAGGYPALALIAP